MHIRANTCIQAYRLIRAAQFRRRGDDPEAKSAVSKSGPDGLTEKEKWQVEKLKQRDGAVRAHEQAHIAAGGSYVTGGPHYTYQTGPDGRQYAVGGEVSIDTSEVPGDPEATIRKMEQVRRAALAPSNPSAQDRQVAATASREATEARLELAEERKTGSAGGPTASASATEAGRQISPQDAIEYEIGSLLDLLI